MTKRIIVDADACPVKKEVMEIGNEFTIPVIFVASFAHFMNDIQDAKIIYVDSTSQSVDMYIANSLIKGDIVITGDYGLASMVLKPGIKALSFRGMEYTQDILDELLAQRYYSSKVRRGGGKTKGPKAMNIADRKKFVENLRKNILEEQENLK